MKPFFHWSLWMYWFMHQTSLIRAIRLRKMTNQWHFCQHQNHSNSFLQCCSLYAQLKTAETITKKIFEKKSSLTSKPNNFNLGGLVHKSIHSLWSVEQWLHFEEFWEVFMVVVKILNQTGSVKFLPWSISKCLTVSAACG